MAGGTITRISLGTSITEVEGNFEGFYENLTMNAGKENRFTAKTTNHGTPKEQQAGKHFVKGWWSSKDDGSDKITEALIGDIVYFHLQTKDIPNGKTVFMSLFDDDVKRASQEKDQSEGSDKIKLYPMGTTDYSDKNESRYETVKDNKIVKRIFLGDYFSSLAAQEDDKTVELFFACSYDTDNVELPISFADYLKVKGMPKIIFVNGQWNLASKVPLGLGNNFGPTEPRKPYWSNGIANKFLDYIKDEHNIDSQFLFKGKKLTSDNLESKNFILYYDGSSNWGLDQSGGDRFNKGRKFAQENFEEVTKGLGRNEVFLYHIVKVVPMPPAWQTI